MDKLKISQVLKLSLIAALLVITPLLSSSLRPTYLYFIFNLLILSLGADAGLLNFFSSSSSSSSIVAAEDYRKIVSSSTIPELAKPYPNCKELGSIISTKSTIDHGINCEIEGSSSSPKRPTKAPKLVEKSLVSEKIGNRVKKCPSTPSLFFIGGDEEEEVEEEEEELISGQELFTKAETFIGNFYKQLKMQREDSWRKIHGLYHKAF